MFYCGAGSGNSKVMGSNEFIIVFTVDIFLSNRSGSAAYSRKYFNPYLLRLQ
jgi:hypothetical protein